MKKEPTREEILEICKKVYEKTLASDIEPIRFEDIPKMISEILSMALKRKVNVSGSGLDGKDMIVDVCGRKK